MLMGTDLFNFAIMANTIAKMRTPNPRVGVLNIGTEIIKVYHIIKKLMIIKTST
nr:hypothetical protein [Ureaplasma parvum]